MFHHLFSKKNKTWLTNHGLPYLGKLLLQTTGSGVELFFVLSGVVLLRPYLRGRRGAEHELLPANGAWSGCFRRIWSRYLGGDTRHHLHPISHLGDAGESAS